MYHGTGNQSIPDNTSTLINWDSVIYDHGGLQDPADNTKLVVPLTGKITGVWAILANVQFASNGTGQRQLQLYVNGGLLRVAGCNTILGGFVTPMEIIHFPVDPLPGDYYQVKVLQNSGAPLNAQVNGSRFALIKIPA